MTTASQTSKSLTLEQAVAVEAGLFYRAGSAFSIFDITTALREKVNRGILTIDNIPVRTSGVMRQEIFHDPVRTAFEAVYGEFAGKFGIDTDQGYRRFTPIAPAAPVVAEEEVVVGPVVNTDVATEPVVPTAVAGIGPGTLTGISAASVDPNLTKLNLYIDNDTEFPITVRVQGEHISINGRGAWRAKSNASYSLNGYVAEALGITRHAARALTKAWRKSGIIELHDAEAQ